MIKTSPSLSDGSGVGQHAHSTLNLGQVSTWHNSWGLVVDSNLESSGTPVHKLDAPLGLDGGDGVVDVLGHHISSVQHAACHVLSVSGITLDHLVGWLEASVGDLSNAELLV